MRDKTVVSLICASFSFAAFQNESAAASKDECVEAHSRGQDLREKGQLGRAKQTFLTCAQAACPGLVQADCARFAEELAHLVPTVTFSARDRSAADLPATSVFVDDVLVATHLDDGTAYEVDPGKHVVRYVHGGNETTLRVVLNQGEKGRLLLATFAAGEPATREAPAAHRPVLPLVVAGIGGAVALTGTVLVAVGMGRVPGNCSVSKTECTAPANDPSLDQAKSGVSLADFGVGVVVAGAATLAVGIAWYFLQPAHPNEMRLGRIFQPAISF